MEFKIIHLNIERDKHIKNVYKLLKKENPGIICLMEIISSDAQKIAKDFKYQFAYTPQITKLDKKTQGVAIFSKYKIIDSKIYRYDKNKSIKPPYINPSKHSNNGNRTIDRFLQHNSVLTVKIKNNYKIINIATTHFPVTDHTTPGYKDHNLDEMKDITEIDYTRDYFDRFILIIKKLKNPLIFTSDLDNPRNEYIYDTLAHTLIDITPKNIDSTIDPKLHRRKNLHLVVDTIMTSSDIKVKNTYTLENISDHKAIVAKIIL